MGYGVPTLVTHAGAFSELPDEAVVKVPGGPGDTVFVERALRALLGDADRRARIGAAARKYVEEACDPQGVAERYAAFIRDAVRDGIRSVAPGAVACWEGR
jgi:glycosyltransferase involved in cell wall biosynthesis